MYDEKPSTRSRRNLLQSNICDPTKLNSTNTCCLYDLMIDFEKVGWDFVIAPKRYNAFLCNGICTYKEVGLFLISNYSKNLNQKKSLNKLLKF